VEDLQRLRSVKAGIWVADLHPDYASTQFARGKGAQLIQVQHHFAHVASCMAEHGIEGPVLGVAWDGTGYGKDGTIWGGEFLVADSRSFERIACLRPFRLPGGDRAVRDPGRSAFGALYEAAGQEAPLSFAGSERELLIRMIDRNVNSPRTTSAGRLFDAVAYLLGLCSRAAYEGQAAMAVEFALENPSDAEPFDIPLRTDTEPWVLDWGPMLLTIADCARRRTPVARIAAGFHRALTESIVAVARRAHQRCVVLTGGCFQNGCLTEGVVRRLQEEDFKVYWHQRVPPNDGGIAVGQAYIAAQRLKGI
jgi:hydrogenase maturation protein HypF